MTFEDDLEGQDLTGRYKSNPYTQDVSRSKDNKAFQQSPLLRVDHEDPSLHYIGEGLPKPGDTEATWAGRETFVGTSPIPARADHSHDTFLYYGVYNRPSNQACPPGNTNLILDYFAGDDYKATSTLLSLPRGGIWLISSTLIITRDGGGNMTGRANLVYFYSNGEFGRRVHRDTNEPTLDTFSINATDFAHYTEAQVGVSATLELQYQHSDVVNHIVNVSQLTVVRLADR